MKKVYIETMGCQMNKSDTERMFGMLSNFGYEETDKPKEADLLMVNTSMLESLSLKKIIVPDVRLLLGISSTGRRGNTGMCKTCLPIQYSCTRI